MSDNKAQEVGGDDGTSQAVRIKEEPNNMKDYAEDTMNELLGWYGYGDVGQDARSLQVKELFTADESPRQVSPQSRLEIKEDEDPSDSRVNTQDEPPSNLDVLQRLTESGDGIHACAWCQKRGSRMLTLETPSGRRHYCSEQCFTQSRRASFKRNRVCDWCRHVRYTISFVDFQDGENQLQFCSDKCLNQYKMNIFCRETQEHLRSIHSSLRNDLINGKRLGKSKQILITPDLWMKDEEQETPLNLKTPKPKNKETSTNGLIHSAAQDARQKIGCVRQKVVANGDHTVSPHSCKETIVNWDNILQSKAKRVTPVSSPSTNKSGTKKQPGRIRSLLKSHNLPQTSGFKSSLLSPAASVSSSVRQSPVQKCPPSSEPSVGQTPPLFLDPPKTPSVPNSGSTTPMFRRTPVTPSLQPPFTLPHHFLFPPLPLLPPHPFAPIVPPTTCLVPYPIVLPFPVPIPIPLPIEKSKWEEMKKKALEHTISFETSSCSAQSSTTNDDIEVDHTSGTRDDNHTPTAQCNSRTVRDESDHSPVADIRTSGAVPKERALLSIPKTDHAYSLRRSLILDAPNVPKKRHRSASPNERHYKPKKALNLALNNKKFGNFGDTT